MYVLKWNRSQISLLITYRCHLRYVQLLLIRYALYMINIYMSFTTSLIVFLLNIIRIWCWDNHSKCTQSHSSTDLHSIQWNTATTQYVFYELHIGIQVSFTIVNRITATRQYVLYELQFGIRVSLYNCHESKTL